MGRGERNHMKKENNFLDLMGEIDEKFVTKLPCHGKSEMLS